MTTLATTPFDIGAARHAPVAERSVNTLWPLPVLNRPRRVIWLTGLILLLSALDLALTLQYMTTIGMFEANPLARWIVVTTACRWALSAFKVALTLFGIIVLYALRDRLSAEVGAWIGAGVFAALTLQWWLYSRYIASLDPTVIEEFQAMPGWVMM